MKVLRVLASALAAGFLIPLLAQVSSSDATFGTIVAPVSQGGVNYLLGGASDLVLDEGRGRLYLVNPGQRRVEVYSITQRRFLGVVQTDAAPISAAISRDRSVLYVTCFEGSALNIIDLERLAVVRSVSLPAKPEGVAVGYDETVLITTIGTGQNNLANVLLIFDPSPEAAASPIANVIVTPDPPPSPVLPPPAGRVAFAARTNLVATRDGDRIIGFLAVNNNQRSLFVYEVVSRGILRSRRVNETSTVLSVAPDGSKFMAGLRLFDTETLQVMGQQNAANLPYVLPTGSNFNLQQNQGGSAFAPDGSVLYSAFNFAPMQNPPARANISQLLVNDPDNLLTQAAFKLPENLAGNMVIDSDGSNIYALSESGFLVLPVGRLREYPIAVPETVASLLASDQCGVTADMRSATIKVRNAGSGRFTASAQLVPTVGAGANLPAITTPGGTGAGSGIPGGGSIIIVQPPIAPGAQNPPGVNFPTGTTNLNAQQQVILQTAPSVSTRQTPEGTDVQFTYNSLNTRSLGTIPPHDFQIVATNAINIPPQVRIYQNMRDAESRGGIAAVPAGPSGAEGLVDMVADQTRQRLYIANSGLNRIEVFDMRTQTFLPPIKAGQLPRSLALTPDGYTLYVANSGGESISIVDAESLTVIGRVKFPPLPFNSTIGIVYPSVIAATERGLIVVMSDGSLWKVVDDEAIPRAISPIIGSSTVAAPRSLAATPGGEFALLLAGNGSVYLYDALSDEFVQTRQVVSTPIQSYYGPVAAGPRGQYFLVNGMVLNQALSIVSSAGSVNADTGRPGATTSVPKPVAAVAPMGATTFARFVPPAIANANVLAAALPTVEMVDANTGQVRGQAYQALEGPLQTVAGTARVNINGRTMAVDAQGAFAYVLTTSGLSIVPMQTPPATDRPVISNNGIVNFVTQQQPIGQGGLISIYGRNLGSTASPGTTSLPSVLGGMCVTLGTRMLPLALTSPTQINALVPQDIAPGQYQIVIRNIEQKAASSLATFRVQKYAPAVIVDDKTGQAAIYHDNGQPVTKQNPAHRDDRLHMYATGLGPVKNWRTTAGDPTPETPVYNSDPVQVFFDDPRIKESKMDVEESILMPGMIGVFRIQVYVPWYRRRGEKLLVTVRVGNVDSPSKGNAVPYITVE